LQSDRVAVPAVPARPSDPDACLPSPRRSNDDGLAELRRNVFGQATTDGSARAAVRKGNHHGDGRMVSLCPRAGHSGPADRRNPRDSRLSAYLRPEFGELWLRSELPKSITRDVTQDSHFRCGGDSRNTMSGTPRAGEPCQHVLPQGQKHLVVKRPIDHNAGADPPVAEPFNSTGAFGRIEADATVRGPSAKPLGGFSPPPRYMSAMNAKFRCCRRSNRGHRRAAMEIRAVIAIERLFGR